MAFIAISRKKLPNGPRNKLHDNEGVYGFGYIDYKGGCNGTSTAEQWIMITDQRIVYEASVKEGTGTSMHYSHRSGSIPLAKISRVETSTSQNPEGCSFARTTSLAINTSGGRETILAIPTKDDAEHFQEIIDELISAEEEKR